jgi:hypothetical protein
MVLEFSKRKPLPQIPEIATNCWSTNHKLSNKVNIPHLRHEIEQIED